MSDGEMIRAEAVRKGFRGFGGAGPFRRGPVVPVLDGVSFQVERGECFGIVGRNGSGKTTLMKIIAGILKPDSGHIDVSGGLASFLALGVGFVPELSVRDNAVIKGVAMGMPRDVIRSRVPRLLEFAELSGDELTPYKNLSAGMRTRLAFAVAMESEPEILLVDEVLGVGDAGFQAKCAEVFAEFQSTGKTIILASHSMGEIKRLCDRAMLLEAGTVAEVGDPAEVAGRYNQLFLGDRAQERASDVLPGFPEQDSAPRANIERLSIAGGLASDSIQRVAAGEPLTITFSIKVTRNVGQLGAAVVVFDREGTAITAPAFERLPADQLDSSAGGRPEFELRIQNRLVPGRYTLSVVATRISRRGRHFAASDPESAVFDIHGSPVSAGFVSCDLTVRRVDGRSA